VSQPSRGASSPVILTDLADEYLRALFETYPPHAASLGLHEYDGRVQDYTDAARADRVSALSSFAARLAGVDPDSLDPDGAHDYTLLRLAVEDEIFDLTSLCETEYNPMAFSGSLDVSGYVKRSYAPLVDRVARLSEHLRQFPGVLASARRLLRRPVPVPILDASLETYDGLVQFHDQDLPAAAREVGAGPSWTAFEQANAEALAALRAFVVYLRDDLRPRATEAFAIGEARLETMLRLGEMVDAPLDRLRDIGQEDLVRNRARLDEIAGRLGPGVAAADVIRRLSRDHPTAAQLIPEAARVLEEIREFVVARRVVSIASDVRCLVEPTPPFARWAFAMMDTAGPFETAPESFYYVTPPDPTWTPEATEEWLTKFDYATLRDVGIHEAYPGHYVHFLAMRDIPRRLRRVLTSYSCVEGWAHYCEEMMLEAGYRDGDDRLRLAQLSEALLRNVRFAVAIEMHARGMTVAEATRRFVEEAFLEPLPAEKEAIRGTFDPGYLNYTLGKLMVRKLRDDVRAAEGSGFSLLRFHDRLLSLGAPPIPLARRALLGDAGSAL